MTPRNFLPGPIQGRCLPVLLCWLLAFPATPRGTAQQGPAPELRIVIVDGEDAVNNIRQRTAREPIVQVEDKNHRPVAGAAVIFTLPQNGASGSFAGNVQTFSTVTDANGRAVAQGLQPNTVAGKVQIRVDATYQGQTGHAVINQKNVLKKAAKSSAISAKLLTILVVAAAAGAVGGVCAAVCGGKSNTGAVITAGGATVGAPH